MIFGFHEFLFLGGLYNTGNYENHDSVYASFVIMRSHYLSAAETNNARSTREYHGFLCRRVPILILWFLIDKGIHK